jgi:hypothetical protein
MIVRASRPLLGRRWISAAFGFPGPLRVLVLRNRQDSLLRPPYPYVNSCHRENHQCAFHKSTF